jgi:hypothetical protein
MTLVSRSTCRVLLHKDSCVCVIDALLIIVFVDIDTEAASMSSCTAIRIVTEKMKQLGVGRVTSARLQVLSHMHEDTRMWTVDCIQHSGHFRIS